MLHLNFWAIVVATVVVFVISSVWYIAFNKQYSALRGVDPQDAAKPQPAKIVVELVRSLILATIVAGLASLIGISSFGGALLLGVVLWIGFPLMLLSGSILWDSVSWKLAAIHGGDWFLKLLAISLIVGLWR
jgi:hypothetical protein